MTTMLDASIPLTINEWDEWGDPRDPDDYACMRSYSPYDNPPSGPRPALLVTGAVHDARVADPRARQVGREAAGDRHRRARAPCSGRRSASGRTAGHRGAALGSVTKQRSRRSSCTQWESRRR